MIILLGTSFKKAAFNNLTKLTPSKKIFASLIACFSAKDFKSLKSYYGPVLGDRTTRTQKLNLPQLD